MGELSFSLLTPTKEIATIHFPLEIMTSGRLPICPPANFTHTHTHEIGQILKVGN